VVARNEASAACRVPAISGGTSARARHRAAPPPGNAAPLPHSSSPCHASDNLQPRFFNPLALGSTVPSAATSNHPAVLSGARIRQGAGGRPDAALSCLDRTSRCSAASAGPGSSAESRAGGAPRCPPAPPASETPSSARAAPPPRIHPIRAARCRLDGPQTPKQMPSTPGRIASTPGSQPDAAPPPIHDHAAVSRSSSALRACLPSLPIILTALPPPPQNGPTRGLDLRQCSGEPLRPAHVCASCSISLREQLPASDLDGRDTPDPPRVRANQSSQAKR